VIPDLPLPDRHCGACGRGHFVPVPFCPFCGSRQDILQREIPPGAPPAVSLDRDARSDPAATPSPAETALSDRPQPGEPDAPSSDRALRRPSPPRWSLRLRQTLWAALMVGALAYIAPERQEGAPAPLRIAIGPAWTSVALAPFRNAPQLRLSGDGAFSLRIDGGRVVRVVPGEGITVGTSYLRSLELRAARPAMITLTPQRD
jgi:hypothetical protein